MPGDTVADGAVVAGRPVDAPRSGPDGADLCKRAPATPSVPRTVTAAIATMIFPPDFVPVPVCPQEPPVCGRFSTKVRAPRMTCSDSVTGGELLAEAPALRNVPRMRSTEIRASLGPNSLSAIASSPTDWNLLARSFSKHFATTRSRPGGASRRKSRRGGAGSFAILMASSVTASGEKRSPPR